MELFLGEHYWHRNFSLVTQTHSLHASERVWWTPTFNFVHPIPRIWGALILYWLVVNNYTRGDDCHHYVMKPPFSPFKIKFQFLGNTLEYIVDIHCRLLTAPKGDRENQFWRITFKITLLVELLVMALWCNGGNRHSLCNYWPPIGGVLTLPRFWG